MLRKTFLVVLTAVLLIAGVHAATQQISVTFPNLMSQILGRDESFSNAFIHEGELYIPLTEAAGKLGLPLTWDENGVAHLGVQTYHSLRDLVAVQVNGWISFEDDVYWRGTVVNGQSYTDAYRKTMVGLDSSPMTIGYLLAGNYLGLNGLLGVEDLSLVTDKPVVFRIYGDQELLLEQELFHGDDAISFEVDLTGVELLTLEMSADYPEKTPTMVLIQPVLERKVEQGGDQ